LEKSGIFWGIDFVEGEITDEVDVEFDGSDVLSDGVERANAVEEGRRITSAHELREGNHGGLRLGLLTKICGWFFSKMKLTAFVSNTYNCFCGRESEVQI